MKTYNRIKADKMPIDERGKTMEGLKSRFLKCTCILMGVAASFSAFAETEVVSADYQRQSDGGVTITLSTTGDEPVVSVFATEEPARIVLDMADTSSGVDAAPVDVNAGAVRSFTTLSAGGRTRVLVDLNRAVEFDYSTDGGQVTLTLAGQKAMSTAEASRAAVGAFRLQNVDFRRGEDGQGRVIVALDGENASVSVDPSMGQLRVNVFNASMPDSMNQILDVVDFATPVQLIDVAQVGEAVRLDLAVSGEFEHLAYQSGNELIIEVSEVAPVIEQGDDELDCSKSASMKVHALPLTSRTFPYVRYLV